MKKIFGEFFIGIDKLSIAFQSQHYTFEFDINGTKLLQELANLFNLHRHSWETNKLWFEVKSTLKK